MKSVLILGNNGYVGSLLTNRLENECKVVGVDTCRFGPNLGKSFILDVSTLSQDFLASFDVIVCLAAHSSVQLSNVDPKGAIQNNIINLNRLMSSLYRNQRLIYASSASVYGSNSFDAKEGSENYQMHNIYDITKQTGDDFAKGYISKGKNIVGLRFGTICGISPNTRTDLAINNMMLTAHKKGKFWVSNLSTNRSFLAVSDAVDLITRIVLSNNFVSGIYNVKSFDSNMESVANSIREIAGYDYDIVDGEQTSYDFTINISKVNNDYQWTPQSTLHSLIKNIHTDIEHITECRRDRFI